MLKVGGKEVIYSKSFVMVRGEEVVLTPPGVIGRSIQVVATRNASSFGPGDQAFSADESNLHLSVLNVPFADRGVFLGEFLEGQLSTERGRLSIRITGQPVSNQAMLVHFDLLEGRYDNYVEPAQDA